VTRLLAATSRLVLLASASRGSSGSGVARVGTNASSDAPSAREQAVAFASCMRRHGVNLPGPNPEIRWGQLDRALGWDAAWQACRQLLPPGPKPRPLGAEEIAQLLACAVCMRAHHVEISDPDPATGDTTLAAYTSALAANRPGLHGGARGRQGQAPRRRPIATRAGPAGPAVANRLDEARRR
jgi:hypothetical protein